MVNDWSPKPLGPFLGRPTIPAAPRPAFLQQLLITVGSGPHNLAAYADCTSTTRPVSDVRGSSNLSRRTTGGYGR